MQLSDLNLFSDANLQGYWKFESNWNDSSPNGYTLTPTNSPTFVSGKYGNAGHFVSASSQLSKVVDASCANLEIAGSQTWVQWIKPTTIASYMATMAKRNGGTGAFKGFQLSTDFGGDCYFTLQGLTTNTQVNSGNVISTGVYSHVAGRYDSAGTTLKIYVNGVEKDSKTASGSAVDTNGDFGIGASGDGAFYYNGDVDEAAIFNRALTAAEISLLAGVAVNLTDSGSGADTLTLLNSIGISESVVGLDAVTISTTLSTTDTGTGVDTIAANLFRDIDEAGIGVDEIELLYKEITVNDTGTGIDTIALVFKTVLVNDTGTGTDSLAVILFINVADSGLGVDNIGSDVVRSLMRIFSQRDNRPEIKGIR